MIRAKKYHISIKFLGVMDEWSYLYLVVKNRTFIRDCSWSLLNAVIYSCSLMNAVIYSWSLLFAVVKSCSRHAKIQNPKRLKWFKCYALLLDWKTRQYPSSDPDTILSLAIAKSKIPSWCPLKVFTFSPVRASHCPKVPSVDEDRKRLGSIQSNFVIAP